VICPPNAAIAYQFYHRIRDTFVIQSIAMSNIIKKSLGKLLGKLLTPAYVLRNCKWKDSSIHQLSISLPGINVEAWKTIRRLKIQVGPLEYRDYTPALWDKNNKSCTLFIDAGHIGTGSEWVANLREGNQVLIGDAHAANLPPNEGPVLGLGDASALGHFLAFKQLTDQASYPIQVGIFTHGRDQAPMKFQTDHPEISLLSGNEPNAKATLESWAMSLHLERFTSICIAGNNTLVKDLRSHLKSQVNRSTKIYGHGFWS
jgi:NADPH-dependent ferric siderophore reductase